jgi:hypothetical protein
LLLLATVTAATATTPTPTRITTALIGGEVGASSSSDAVISEADPAPEESSRVSKVNGVVADVRVAIK